MQTTILTLLVTAVLVPGARGFSSGAPDYTCNRMRPNHNLDPLENPPPFSVTVSSDNYQANVPLQVQIVASPGRMFKGFMIQARPAGNPDNGVRVGDFVPIDGTKSVCGTNGLTHTKKLSANTITINWSTVSELQGDIIFRATVVESFSLWYAGIDSKVITAGVPPTTTTTAPTTTTTTLAPTTIITTTASSPSTTTTTTTSEQTLFQTTPSNTKTEKNTVSTPPKSTTATTTTKAALDSASDPLTSSSTTSQPTVTSTTPVSEVVQGRGDDVSGTGDAGQSPSNIITGSKDNQNPDSGNGAKLAMSSSRLLFAIVFVSCLFFFMRQ